jgi:membrane protein
MKRRGAASNAVERPPAKWRARLDDTRERGMRAAEWARERLPWGDVLAEALERERLGAAGLLAGGLAYRLFFWIVPLGLVLAAVLSFWVETDRAGLETAAREFGIGGAAASAATDAIEGDAHSRWYFLVIGLALLVWFGVGVVRALNVAHAVAWRLRPEKVARPFLAGGAFTVVMISVIGVTTAAAALREQMPGPGLVVTLALVVLYLAAFSWASSLLPSRASGWRPFLPGAIYVALGTQLVHLLVALYLAPRLGRSSELYGALGASTVILLWLYLEARLVVGAAFLNAALWDRRHPAAASPDSS